MNTPVNELVDEPHPESYRGRGGRTIEENENRHLCNTFQVGQTKTVEELAFEGRHG